MRLSRYGIVLETMTSDHLEMIRLWRNQDYIREKMHYQELLSRTDQQAWFKTLDKDTNLYWIIRFKNYPIGLVHIKDINLKERVGEAGIFIGEPSFLEMPQPMLAILFMMELAFYAFNLSHLKAKIHSQNHKAIRFNKQLGYQLMPDQPKGFQYYAVDKEQFENATHQLRSRSAKLYGQTTTIDQLQAGTHWDNQLKSLSPEAAEYFA